MAKLEIAMMLVAIARKVAECGSKLERLTYNVDEAEFEMDVECAKTGRTLTLTHSW